MNFEKIKLVIWDLDNTFWSGIISEGAIEPILSNNKLVGLLTDCGVLNSICSKNTFEMAVDKLKEIGVFDYFVFPSIEWTPKGHRVNEMIKMMALRPENVLFIDDEITNQQEVKHYSDGIMVAGPEIIPLLYNFVSSSPKADLDHTRLQQYKLLEVKHREQIKYASNEEFLYASNIRVEICYDCIAQFERIHDLLMRSNQLNFTKKRISKEELSYLFQQNTVQCSYVTVTDRFGNYGIVGFCAVENNKLLHFLFSCRTIGLGIEQYVYAQLNFPSLLVVEPVVGSVHAGSAPLWINQPEVLMNNTAACIAPKVCSSGVRFLIKGPCNLSQVISYIKNRNLFDCEFNYINAQNGNVIEGHNHSVNIAALPQLTENDKREVLKDCIFVDNEMFSSKMFENKFDIIFLSTLIESYAGIYKKKNSNIRVVVGSSLFPITNKAYWEGLINGSLYSSKNVFTYEYLTSFSQKYEFEGRTSPSDYCESIKKILNNLDANTRLCLLLGVEFPYDKNSNELFTNRHIFHAQLNAAIRTMAQDNPRILLLDLNEVIHNQSDFVDNINQFTPSVNYALSQKMISIINQHVPAQIENYATHYVYLDAVLQFIKSLVSHFLSPENKVRRALKRLYYKMSRNVVADLSVK